MAISIERAKALVIEFCAEYPVASKISYKIRNTQEEALDEPRATIEREGRIYGAYFPGRGYAAFAVSNFRDEDDFKGTLRHEILGHFGINTFHSEEKRALLEALIQARNEPVLRITWAMVDQNYPGMSDMRKAEEVYAFSCEAIEPNVRTLISPGAQVLQQVCIERRRPLTFEDLINLTTMVAEGLHDRTRSQQIFPESDSAQFKQDSPMKTSEYPVWLAVPPDDRDKVRAAAGQLNDGRAAVVWDREAKLWYARPGCDLDRIQDWMPDRSRRAGGGDPEAEFLDVLTQAGLIVKGMPLMDGARQRVATIDDKHGKQSGVYCGFLDRRPGGWFINYHRADSAKAVTNWSATGGESDPITSLHIRAAARQSQDDVGRERAAVQAAAAAAAKQLYDRLPAADPAHPYLVRKGIPPTPDLRQTRNGALVVPFFNAEGMFKTLQYIPPEGEKYLFENAPKQEHFLVVGGSLDPAQPILYAEGYATARSLNLATGLPVVMTIDAGNMVAVAKVLHQQYPTARHLFMADFDHAKDVNKGLIMATEAAAQVGGQVLYPTFNEAEIAQGFTDFNDLHQSRGLDAVREQTAPLIPLNHEVTPMANDSNIPSLIDAQAFEVANAQLPVNAASADRIQASLEPNVGPAPAMPVPDEATQLQADLVPSSAAETSSLENQPVSSDSGLETSVNVDETPISTQSASAPATPRASNETVQPALAVAEQPDSQGIDNEAPVSVLPQVQLARYVDDRTRYAREMTDRLGLTPLIEAMYAQGKTSDEISKTVGSVLGSSVVLQERITFINKVAETLGVPGRGPNGAGSEAFALWQQQRGQVPAAPAATQPAAAAIDAAQPDQVAQPTVVSAEPTKAADEVTASAAVDPAQPTPVPSANGPVDENVSDKVDPLLTELPRRFTTASANPQSEVEGISVGARIGADEPPLPVSQIDKDLLLTRITNEPQSDNSVLYKLDKEPAFVDRGSRLEMVPGAGQSDEKILAALLTAARFYRGAIELTGSDAFKGKAIELIAQNQVNVSMKNPAQQLMLDQARQALNLPVVKADAIHGDTPPPFDPVPPATPLVSASTAEATTPPSPAKPEQQAAPIPVDTSANVAYAPLDAPGLIQPAPVPVQSGAQDDAPLLGVARPSQEVKPDVQESHQASTKAVDPAIHQLSASAVQGVTGKVISCGKAPFRFDPENSESVHIKLRTKTGIQTFWGMELAGLLRETRIEPGRMATLHYLGEKPVTVRAPVKDPETGLVLRYEDKQAKRNQWSLGLLNGAAVRTGDDQGVKLVAYDAARFAMIQNSIMAQLELPIEAPPRPAEGLFWMTPNGQGSARAGDELSASRPVVDSVAAGKPVMSSWSPDGQLDMALFRGDGPYLQGVVRQGDQYQHVLVSLPGHTEAPPMVINQITEQGLVPIGVGNGINHSGGEPVAREHIAFKLEGDPAVRVAKLDFPAEMPPALHDRLGFDQRWKDTSNLPKSSPAAAPMAQPSVMRPA
jgi:putative DNA primase/helicase